MLNHYICTSLFKLRENEQGICDTTIAGRRSCKDWKLLFQAAVTPLLAKDGGETLAIGLLPGYVNRQPAEKVLVVEATKNDISRSI